MNYLIGVPLSSSPGSAPGGAREITRRLLRTDLGSAEIREIGSAAEIAGAGRSRAEIARTEIESI